MVENWEWEWILEEKKSGKDNRVCRKNKEDIKRSWGTARKL